SSTIDVPVQVYAVNAGLGVGVTAAGGVAPITGRTSATFDGTAYLTGGATIAATGRHTASVFMLSVAAGVYSAGAAYATATISRDTVATLTANATITAAGAIAVTADTRNHTKVSTNGGNLSGMGFSVMLATATVSGATDAIVLGRIRGSGSLAVTA